jgi:hypothetical protein
MMRPRIVAVIEIYSFRNIMLIQKAWITLLAVAAPLMAAPLSSFVESDAQLYLSFRDMGEVHSQWLTHPIAAAVEEAQLQSFLAPLFLGDPEEADEDTFTEVMEGEFGLTWDELFELLPGQMSLVCYNLSDLFLQQAERPDLVVMAEFSGDAERMNELMQVQFERNAKKQQAVNPEVEHRMIEETFMGETLYFDETFDGETTYIEDGYALVDGIFLLASPEERLRSVVEAIKDEPEAALAEDAGYLRSREQGGRGDFELYVNLNELVPPLNEAWLDQLVQGGAFMLGLNEDSLDSVLALESLQGFFIDLDLIESGLALHAGLIYGEKAGLLSLMTYSGAPLPEARFVPKTVFSSSMTNFDLGEMLTQLENLIISASPTLRAQIDSQMQVLQTNTGVDLRAAVLSNFSDEVVSLSVLPEAGLDASTIAEPDQVYVLALEDAQALSDALEAFKDLVPGLREQILTQEFAGQTIYSFHVGGAVPAGGVSTVSYAITRSYLLLSMGRLGLLQEVLSRMESGEAGFWQQDEIEDLFERVEGEHVVSRSFLDLEQVALPMLQAMVESRQLAGGSELDLKQLPTELSLPFYLISGVSESSDGLFNRSFILLREDSK